LNAAIVGPMLTLKELMLTFGIVFEPLGVDDEDEDPDDPQPAAIRPATTAKPTQPTPRERRNVPPCERERRPPSLLLPIPYTSFT
jgi:hypothetical protein